MAFPTVAGEPVVDFVNTRPLKDGAPDERLNSPADLFAWTEQLGLATASEARRLAAAPAPSGLVIWAQGLREAFRAVFADLGAGRPPHAAALDTINAAARGPTREGLRVIEGALVLGPVRALGDGDELVAEIARRGAAFLASPDAGRLKLCQGGACVLWFVDRTRNGSRAWCSMERCGARAKAAAYYQRRKGAAAQA